MGCGKSKHLREDADKPKGTSKTNETANPSNSGAPNLNIQGSNPVPGLRFTPGSFIKKKQSIFYSDYTYVKDLGKGAFGEVIEVLHKVTKQSRAAKMIPISNLTDREKQDILAEIEILKQLVEQLTRLSLTNMARILKDHPNIMKIYEYYEDEQYMMIVGELYSGGELLDKIIEMKSFSEKKAAEAMKQILSAVNYCHKNKIVHRDLKPQNILLDSNAEDAILKVVDFGVSAKIEPNKQFSRPTGTVILPFCEQQ